MNLKEDSEKVRKNLKDKNPDFFPYRVCKPAVISMYPTGYLIVQGTVEVNNYCGIGLKKKLVHYWNKDPETKENIDLTASQFNIHFFEENKFPLILRGYEDNSIYIPIREGISLGETLFG